MSDRAVFSDLFLLVQAIYQWYCSTLRAHLTKYASPALKQGGSLVDQVKHFRELRKLLCRCVKFVDRYHLPSNDLPSLKDTGEDIFDTFAVEHGHPHWRECVSGGA